MRVIPKRFCDGVGGWLIKRRYIKCPLPLLLSHLELAGLELSRLVREFLALVERYP